MLKFSPLLLVIFILLTIVATVAFQDSGPKVVAASRHRFESRLPIGISQALWRRRIPTNNPITQAKVSLGEVLFFDKRLSADGTVSCATCHDPANAFTDRSALTTGVSNRLGARNAPTILNSMFSDQLFWDGRVGSLEEQAKQPIVNVFEMGMSDSVAVVSRLAALPQYQTMFQTVFGREGITIDTIGKAIAAYERTLLSGNSPFDRFISGDSKAISESQKRGWELFKSKAKCIDCHAFSAASPFFSDFKFHNTGIVAKYVIFERLNGLAKESASNERQVDAPVLAHTKGFSELGRYLVTRKSEDIGAFKTPTLRDVELTTPYMHDGSEKTLLDVVRYYNRGGSKNPNLSKRMNALGLTDQEMNDLVEFMRALTSDDVLRRAQSSRPQNRDAASFDLK